MVSPNSRPAHPAAVTLEPATVPMVMVEEIHQRFIRIRRRPDWELVTAVELLSPANKTDPSRGQYLANRNALVAQEVHLVELDFLIGGKRPPMLRPLPPADYYALIARSENRPDCDVYHWTLRDPLPVIPIPLKAPDPGVALNLAEVFATTYDRGRYAPVLGYDAPPSVPLPECDLQWVLEQVAESAR